MEVHSFTAHYWLTMPHYIASRLHYRIVEQSSDELARVLIRMTLGVTLIHLGAERERGFEILRELKTLCVSENFALNAVPLFDVYLARSTAEGGTT